MHRRALRRAGFEFPRLLSEFKTPIDGQEYVVLIVLANTRSLSSDCCASSRGSGDGVELVVMTVTEGKFVVTTNLSAIRYPHCNT